MNDLGPLIAFASFLVAAVTAAGYGFKRSQVTSLRDSLDDADKENARLERRLSDAENSVAQAQRDLEALTRVVSKEVQLTAIDEQLQHMSTMLVEIRDSLRRRSE